MSGNFQEEHIEVLQELFNISYGLATSVIADVLDAYSKMSVPEIAISSIDELRDNVSSMVEPEQHYVVVVQPFLNDFEGESVFITDVDSASNIVNFFYGEESSCCDGEFKSCLSEISNIITSSCMGKLAELLDSEIFFNPPASYIRDGESVVDYGDLSGYYKVLIIKTVFEFKDEKISANLFLLLKEDGFIALSKALDKFLEQY